ncbi:type II secretion system F family protein [Actinocrispum wychmicini]|uniref:Flp pilus assembly protein TadB n=1 Tax=Actinocrispum wychmicini TaxID=1213861 RepID=A0A4R2IXL5_9PSEU|nr:pilus assembly protein TadB [Actinocrispum wychmicini]TCO49642.1 Flp pilus assembly protein TadB [Actinocrispum wychmicini]
MIPALLGVLMVAGVALALCGWAGVSLLPASLLAGLRRPGHWRGLRWLPVAVAAGVAVGWLTGWPVAAVAASVGTLIVPRTLRQRRVAHTIALREALADWAQRLGRTLAAGTGGIEEAIVRSARTTPAALAVPVTDLATRVRQRGLVAALQAFADDINDVTGDALAAALILRATDGGRGLLAVLDNLSASLRQDTAARRTVEVERAKPRTQMKIIIAIVVTVTAILLMSSRLLAAYDQPRGQVWLGVVCLIWGVAFWLADRLTRPERPTRFLRGDTR